MCVDGPSRLWRSGPPAILAFRSRGPRRLGAAHDLLFRASASQAAFHLGRGGDLWSRCQPGRGRGGAVRGSPPPERFVRARATSSPLPRHPSFSSQGPWRVTCRRSLGRSCPAGIACRPCPSNRLRLRYGRCGSLSERTAAAVQLRAGPGIRPCPQALPARASAGPWNQRPAGVRWLAARTRARPRAAWAG